MEQVVRLLEVGCRAVLQPTHLCRAGGRHLAWLEGSEGNGVASAPGSSTLVAGDCDGITTAFQRDIGYVPPNGLG